MDRVGAAAQHLGKGALLAKLDIKSAYHLVPVHPQDRPLLGIEWRGKIDMQAGAGCHGYRKS